MKLSMEPAERLYRRRTIDGDHWRWGGAIDPTGYGRISVNGRMLYVHRYAYELFVGPIPEGYQIDHLCRVRDCWRPSHLEAVTQRENLLRGEGFPGIAHRKTHCKWGHEFTPENTLLSKTGLRNCRECNRAYSREYQRRQRNAA